MVLFVDTVRIEYVTDKSGGKTRVNSAKGVALPSHMYVCMCTSKAFFSLFIYV